MRKVAALVGETDPRLWRLRFRQVEAASAKADFSHVCCVGVDELSVRKGHEYVSVFADLVRKRVLFATEGKEHAVGLQFVEALEQHNGHRHAIPQASLAMSSAYQKGVQATCRHAQVVFAQFHGVMNGNQAADPVRRAAVRLGGAGVWAALHKSQWLGRKNPENLTAAEAARLEKIDQQSLRTAKADQMRLGYQYSYRSPAASVAWRRFRAWCRWGRWVARKPPKNLLRAMGKVAVLVEQHLAGIRAPWQWGVTNAVRAFP